MLNQADADLKANRSVVLDGSYQSKAERLRVCDLARRRQVDLLFILCSCPEPLMKERMRIRAQDPKAVSDGRWEIYLKQKERFESPDELAPGECLRIDTDAPVDVLLSRLIAAINP